MRDQHAEGICQLLAQRFWQITHLIKVVHPLREHPMKDLFCAKSWLVVLGKPLFQLVLRDVQQVPPRVVVGRSGRRGGGINDRQCHGKNRETGRWEAWRLAGAEPIA